MPRFLALLVATFILCTLSCEESPTRSGGSAVVDSTAITEALLIAQWLDSGMQSPASLQQRVRQDLEQIRDRHADVPETAIRYVTSVYSGFIDILFLESAYDTALSGNYHDWDYLNDSLGVDSVVVTQLPYALYVYARIYFDRRLYSSRVVELYGAADLYGVWYIENRYLMLDGDRLYALQRGDTIRYFFRHGYGDCYNGCIRSNIAAFETNGHRLWSLGTYQSGIDTIRPDWLDEFWAADRSWAQQGATYVP